MLMGVYRDRKRHITILSGLTFQDFWEHSNWSVQITIQLNNWLIDINKCQEFPVYWRTLWYTDESNRHPVLCSVQIKNENKILNIQIDNKMEFYKIIKNWQNVGKIVNYLPSEVKLVCEIQNGIFGVLTLYLYYKEGETH